MMVYETQNKALKEFMSLLEKTGVISESWKAVLSSKLLEALDSIAAQASEDLARGVDSAKLCAMLKHNAEWEEFRAELNRSVIVSDFFKSQLYSHAYQAIGYTLYDNYNLTNW